MNFNFRKDIIENNSLLLIIGCTLSLIDLDNIGMIFISIVFIRNFLSSQNKLKFIMQTIAMIIIFVFLIRVIINYELSLYR